MAPQAQKVGRADGRAPLRSALSRSSDRRFTSGIEDLQQCKKTEPGHPQAQKQESPALGRMEFVATVGARVCPANPTQQRRRSIARRYFRGPDIGSVRFATEFVGPILDIVQITNKSSRPCRRQVGRPSLTTAPTEQ